MESSSGDPANPLEDMLRETAKSWGLENDGRVPMTKTQTILNSLSAGLGDDLKTKGAGKKTKEASIKRASSNEGVAKFASSNPSKPKPRPSATEGRRSPELRVKQKERLSATVDDLKKEMAELEWKAGMDSVGRKIDAANLQERMKIVVRTCFGQAAVDAGWDQFLLEVAAKADEFCLLLSTPVVAVLQKQLAQVLGKEQMTAARMQIATLTALCGALTLVGGGLWGMKRSYSFIATALLALATQYSLGLDNRLMNARVFSLFVFILLHRLTRSP
jgi:hypothetical protein